MNQPILPVGYPARYLPACRRGGHLAHDRAVGRRTWEEFLVDQLRQPGGQAIDRTSAERRT